MARIQAALQLDPAQADYQLGVLSARQITILRQAGDRLWVEMEDNQVDTLLAAGIAVSPDPDGGTVTLPVLVFSPGRETPEPPPALAAAAPETGQEAYWLVHFRAPLDKSWMNDVSAAGGEFVQQLAGNAAVVRMTGAEADAVRAMSAVDAVGPWHPVYAVGAQLAGNDGPFNATSLRTLALVLPPPIDLAPGAEDSPRGNLVVTAFEALDPQSLRPALESAGATVVADAPHGYVLQVPDTAAATAVLHVPGVFAADAPSPTLPANFNAGVILGTNQVRDVGTVNFLVNLDGAGEVGGVLDTGFDLGTAGPALHPDLVGNLRLITDSGVPVPTVARPDGWPHGTHVAGSMVSTGASSNGRVRGMAPAAALVGLAPLPAGAAVRVPWNFAAANGARVINNSWGTQPALPAVSNNLYTPAISQVVDQWCYENPDVLVLFAAGNNEDDHVGGPDGRLDARSLMEQSVAKNVLTVGATENLRNNGGFRDNYITFPWAQPHNFGHAGLAALAAGLPAGFTMSDNAGEVALFSSRGQVRDAAGNTGRIKPDVVAPGTNVLSLRSRTLAAPPAIPGGPPPIPDPFYRNNWASMLPAPPPPPPVLPPLSRVLYRMDTGTSMATPLVSGSALLVRQYYRARFGQMRRPLLLEGVNRPAVPPFPSSGARPAVAPHADGVVLAWVTPVLPGAARRIVALRLTRGLAPVPPSGPPLPPGPVQLQAAVGDHAAPKVATLGERTYLLHRHADNTMKLSCYDRRLQPVAGFGGGVVTFTTNTRPDDLVSPDLVIAGGQIACVFPAAGANGYFVQRFDAGTGASLGAATAFLMTDHTGPHQALARTTDRYTVCGVLRPAGRHKLQVRQMADDGSLVGANPATLVDQAQEIRDPCILWDPRTLRHLLVWCDARTQAGGEIYGLFLDAGAAAVGAPFLIVGAPAAAHVRRPRVLLHPAAGYVLLWEDDVQNAHWDVYATLLDATGHVDAARMGPPDPSDPAGRRLVRISDTPEDTEGFAALADATGVALAYHSPDEINSDRVGAWALGLTPLLAFQAQEDANTPLLHSGRYVRAELLRAGDTALTALSAVWAGGSYYLVRQNRTAAGATQAELARLTADGLLDTGFGLNGVRATALMSPLNGCEALWTGNRLITVTYAVLGGIGVQLSDAAGAPVAAFGPLGTRALADPQAFHPAVVPHLGFDPGAPVAVPPIRVIVAYGTNVAGTLHLRYQSLNGAGAVAAGPVDLATVDGVARHGWFQYVDRPSRSIAIYHRTVGANMVVFARRYQPNGAPDAAGEQQVSAAAGDARNGVIARRPVAANSPDREYGAVWQFRANPAAKYEIHFSRLNLNGLPMTGANAPAVMPALPVNRVTDVPVIAAGPGWPANRDAVEPQLICTYTHEPWGAPPAAGVAPPWSPAYGLAWIGLDPDGSRLLFFTVLDENGRRIPVPQPPPPAAPAAGFAPPAPAPILQVSADHSRVRDFRLVWNGRVFMLAWTEEQGTELRHFATLVNRHASLVAYDLPSAALLRATLVNGATNINRLATPDFAQGYGWGRVNLRQSLSPAPPATLHVRDDCALGPGRTVTYRFTLPNGTRLLRVTLNWTDPPGPRVVNPLYLTVRPPGGGSEYRGNQWVAATPSLSRAIRRPFRPADAHDKVQSFKQVVVQNPAEGDWIVEVTAEAYRADPFNQQNLQPFALVFAGTGDEVRFNQPVATVQGTAIY